MRVGLSVLRCCLPLHRGAPLLLPRGCRRREAVWRQLSSEKSSSGVPDLYAVLGVTRSSSKAEIRRAYLDKAKQYHPSLLSSSSSTSDMFRMLADAYFVLSDDSRRRAYDQNELSQSYGGTSSERRGPWRPSQHENAEEVFNKIFGQASNVDMEEKSHNVGVSSGIAPTDEYCITIDLEQALKGCDVTLKLMLRVTCPRCLGSLSEPGYTWNVCPYCEGTGVETHRVGHVLSRRECSYCHGTKRFYKYPCLQCEGKGKVIVSMDYTFAIPAGTQDGQVLRVPIEGDFMKYTDHHHEEMSIFVYVTVRESVTFKVDTEHRLDVISEEDLSPTQALLGGVLLLKGLHEDLLQLQVFAGTNSHSIRYIPQGGVRLPTSVGDHCVSLGISVPSTLSFRAEELWRRFAKDDLDVEGSVTGVDAENDHKYEVNVVEASKIDRPFNIKSTIKEDDDIEDKMLVIGDLRRVWRKVAAMG